MPAARQAAASNDRLRNAPAIAVGQHGAGLHAGRREINAIRVVAKAVAHRVNQRYGALAVAGATGLFRGEGLHGRVVAVDEGRGAKGVGLHP